jgi:hypothetical protein
VRRVACFAAASTLSATEQPESALDSLIELVQTWLRAKNCPSLGVGRVSFDLPDGRAAAAARNDWSAKSGRMSEITLDEPTEIGRFFTRICLGFRDGKLHVFLELRAGASGYQIAPVSVDVRSPQIVKDLFARRTWAVGATPIPVGPIAWHGRESVGKFVATMRHRERNLPIVAVSQSQGQALTTSLSTELARDLCGLALVVDLDDSASWVITSTLGREWSCYKGAIRIYWPLRGARNSFDHPLWTRERLLAGAANAGAASSRIRNQLRRRLLSLSTFAVDDPPELVSLREEAGREHFERMRHAAEESGDQAMLSEQYFNECVRLEGIVERQRAELEIANARVHSLTEAWRYTEESAGDEIPPEPAASTTTVEEAVTVARSRFPSDLVFGADVPAAISTLSADAGPPDKIYQYLKTLAEMTRARRAGSLGMDMLLWLKNEGLKVSGESETVLNNPAEVRKRVWDDGNGRRSFEKHLKPSDGTSPDRCVRVYFDYDEERAKTVVGYVGRHL